MSIEERLLGPPHKMRARGLWQSSTRPYYLDAADVKANTISSAPLVLVSSRWKRSSARTFLRRLTKRASMRGDWPRTDEYISIKRVSNDDGERDSGIPMTILATSQTNSPNRGSVTCLRSMRSMGSSRTSSRPARAIRSPSRWISSCISANLVVGGTFWWDVRIRPGLMRYEGTLRRTESRAAEYLKLLSSRSYSFRRFERLLSTRNSLTSPTGLDLTLDLTVPLPMSAVEAPRKDCQVPEDCK